MKMDRKSQKELTRMGKKTVNGLIGMRMDRRKTKELLRVGWDPIFILVHTKK